MRAAAASEGCEGSIDGARRGDPEALASLYRSHGAVLWRLAYRLTGTRQDAEDVVHDVCVGLPEALRRYEERGSFAGWLKRVTARVALMRLRARRRRREEAIDETLPTTDPPPDSGSVAVPAGVEGLPGSLRRRVLLN